MSEQGRSRSALRRWSFAIILLLLTWGLRLCWLEEVPPGWRDDELINIHALSGRLLEGDFPLYFTGASGHEPLYHYLHAAVHAALGSSVISGHLVSVAFGTLTVALTYSVARRLFGRTTAAIASLGLATSFWSLMYSRTAIRHVSLPPFALATFYVLPVSRFRGQRAAGGRLLGWLLTGILTGASLYAYTASRLLPVLLVAFAAYLALLHRDRFSRHRRGFVLALAAMALLAAPLGVAVAQGRSTRAIQGIGADARVTELARPLRALQEGDPRPMLKNTWTTLRMFDATGDPEWLYNISGRSVFNLVGAVLVWAGVVICVYRWREPRCFLLILWLGLGLLPAFVSTPSASLSHTILAQPVVYILPALAIGKLVDSYIGKLVRRWSGHQSTRPKGVPIYQLPRIIGCLIAVLFLTTNAARDLRDYFVAWPRHGMTRTLYRADYREAAEYLNAHPEITDVAISSTLLGPWDRLALEMDVERADVSIRLFNPERALIWAAESQSATQKSPVLLTSWPDPSRVIEDLLKDSAASPQDVSPHLKRYTLIRPFAHSHIRTFSNGLALTEARWLDEESLAPGREAVLLTAWHVSEPLDLPPMPVVANPPPPGVYAGPRLSVFAHLLDADGEPLALDDGLWVDPLTLEPGDRFVQIHRFAVPESASGDAYALELGLYDPKNGERWPAMDAEGRPIADRVTLRWTR